MPDTATPLVWDAETDKTYSTGVSNCAIFVGDTAEAWNGLTAINEAPSGAESTALFANDRKYMELRANEEYGFTLEAYMYPDLFEQCDGSASIANNTDIHYKQAERKHFGLAYVTKVFSADGSYKRQLHVIFDASASPSSRDHSTINESPEAVTFSWECTTTPVTVVKGTGGAEDIKACNIEITETTANATKFNKLMAAMFVEKPNFPNGKLDIDFITANFVA